MKIRETIFWSHLVIGALIGAVVLFLSVSGMMLSFRPQIIAWAEQGQYQTSEMQKRSPIRLFMKKIEGFHRWFGVEGPLKPVVHQFKGAVTGLLLLMLISGMYLWVPRKVMKLKNNLQGQGRDWNRHNVYGFWTVIFLMIITVSGLLLTYLPPSPKPPAGEKESSLRQFKKLLEKVHTGEAGGIAGQIIVFTATGGAVILVCTGYAMAARRFARSTKKKESHV